MGAIEEAKGKAKEAVGSVTGSDDVRREGQAQQRKADEETKAEQARMEAEEREAKADRHARTESRHQGT